MKKFFIILSALTLVAACSKEAVIVEDNTIDNNPSSTEENTTTVTFTATLEESDSKGTMSSGVFSWSEGEEIAVWTSGDGAQKRTAEASSVSGDKASFTFTLGENETIANDAIFVYPASMLTSEGVVTFSGVGVNAVLAAQRSGSNLAFKHLCGVMEATIKDVPAVATKIEVTSSVALTGAHTIAFSDGTPGLSTTSTAKTVEIPSPSSGSNTIVLPIPSTSSQTITFTVKYNDSNLFTKSTTKELARTDYLKMKDLTINPGVYIVSSMTGWDGDSKVAMSSGSISLNALANQCWRPIVVYPTGFWVYYGFTGSDSSYTSGTFNDITSVADGKMSAIIGTSEGNYTLSFNYVNGSYSSTLNADSNIADFYIADSSFGNKEPMTKVKDKIAYSVKQWGNGGGTLYGYYNDYSASQGGNWTVGSENYYLWVYDFSSNTMKPCYSYCNSAGSWTLVKLAGNNDEWTRHNMQRVSTGSPAWYIDVDWSGKTEFGFEATGPNEKDYGWQGCEGSRVMTENIGSYCPSVSIENEHYTVDEGKYRIIFFESNRFAILYID